MKLNDILLISLSATLIMTSAPVCANETEPMTIDISSVSEGEELEVGDGNIDANPVEETMIDDESNLFDGQEYGEDIVVKESSNLESEEIQVIDNETDNDGISFPSNTVNAIQIDQTAVDNMAPVLEDIALDKTCVTVGSVITITAKIADESGVKGNPSVTFYCGEASRRIVELISQGNDIYKGTITITEDFVNGEYSLIWLMVYDVHDNGKAYKFQSISDPYYNPDLKFVVSGAQTDNAAPVVESIELDKTDVTVGDVVTITVKITDESGVKGTPSIGYYSDSSPTYTTILTKQGNDIYKGTIAITDQLANGEYYIQWLMVRDIYGNGKIYNFQYSDGPYYNPELVIRVQRYDHIWDQGVVTKKATCTEDGEKLYTCTTCQITKTETITATGHKEIKDPAVEPSCEIAGKTEGSHCSVCNTVLIPQDIIQATGHDWVAIVNKQERSCTEPVSIIYACSICQETKTEKKYVGGHHLYGLWKISSVATVFAPAQLTRECVGCGKAEKKNAGNKLQSTMKVSATAIPLKVKQTTTILKVTGLAKGDSIASWKSSNTKIATISGKTNGTCTIKAGKKTGKATITITLKSGLQKKVIVSVQKGAVQTKKITGIAKTLKLKKNQKAVLRPVVTPLTSTQKVTYKSSNSKVVAVNSKGQITAKKKGTATITVKSGGKSVKCKVTVK